MIKQILAYVLICTFSLSFPLWAESSTSTADHSQFEELKKEFTSGPEVTKACLSCHTEASRQIQQSLHWRWKGVDAATGKEIGKSVVLNNYCISSEGNNAVCANCHIGYEWESGAEKNYNFADTSKVDCLVCHDTTKIYKRKNTRPADLTKLAEIVKNVGPTSRDTCGECHFKGGGGDGVKHGDLDTSLRKPSESLDVHMASDGLNFSCTECHATDTHSIDGSRYHVSATDRNDAYIRGQKDERNLASCQSCHSNDPHENERLDLHAQTLACQTCHIPSFARGGIPTKTVWDWSTAARMGEDGKPFSVKDETTGYEIYSTKKGTFAWEENVIPEYQWFNGNVITYERGDKIDPSQIVQINTYEGKPQDGVSKIWPLKVFRGKQPYDTENMTLISPHLAGGDPKTAFWKTFDWDTAFAAGMKESGQPYSGKYDFVATEMRWPITHMVAPKEDAVACTSCHSKNGRLDQVPGIYIPGAKSGLIDRFFLLAIAMTFLGVVGHGLLRIFLRKKG